MDSNSYVDNSQQGGEFGKIGIKYEKDHVTYLCAGMICESENISKIICEYRNDIEVITKNNRRKSYQIKYTSSSVIPFSKICDAVKLFKALNNVERYHEFVLVSNKNFTNKDMQGVE